jgi:hypothetical protein
MKVDGRIVLNKPRRNGAGQGFYGTTVKNLDFAGNLKGVKDPVDFAQLVVKAFIDNPTLLQEYASEAAAVTAGLKSGTIYRTATGELRIKL